jgi:hypothetical protein
VPSANDLSSSEPAIKGLFIECHHPPPTRIDINRPSSATHSLTPHIILGYYRQKHITNHFTQNRLRTAKSAQTAPQQKNIETIHEMPMPVPRTTSTTVFDLQPTIGFSLTQ